MAQLDRRVPAVYIDIEDRSFIGGTNELDRSAYVVIVGDRGPHNRIVEINDWDTFKLLFGEPNFEKTGHAHYLCYKHLQRAKHLYVCRVAMDDATLANVAIKYNDPNGSSQIIYGNFSFTHNSTTVVADETSIQLVSVGDLVYSVADTYLEAEEVVSITNDPSTHTYTFELANPYTGTTTVNDDLYIYYPGSYLINGNFVFTNNSNTVYVNPVAPVNEFSVGDWIYPDSQNSSYSRQVIDIDIYNGEITLDDSYTGPDTTSDARRYIPFTIISQPNIQSESELLETDTDNLWYFYANGVGSYYNKLFIRGVRNVEYETIYTDDDGNPLYKYAFMNIGLYEEQNDGTAKLIGGPWVVSLINNTSQGDIIVDIVTGRQLYIEEVINANSEIVKCKSAMGVDVLLNDSDAELKRLQVLSLLSEDYVIKRYTLGSNGVQLQNGSVGSQYDSSGRLNLASNTALRGMIAKAYEGTLTSTDGSIENITQAIYPWYVFDYVYCGGYDPIVQNSARLLADTRDDCLVLADTGYNALTEDEDLGYRQTSVPWNTYNAMLYTQYRQIQDSFTGKKFYVTPVYHAIERHLYVDDKYWIAEPVANNEKGAIEEKITLSYRPKFPKLGDMIDEELNPTIVEPDGTYFLTQLTTYKRLSIMKRAHVVKFIHFLKHQIPTLLKDILQRKATQYWKHEIYRRLNDFMIQFLENSSYDRYAAIKKFELAVEFDEQLSEAIVLLKIWPIRAIERITVRIVVY